MEFGPDGFRCRTRMLKWFTLPVTSYSSEETTTLDWLIRLRWFALVVQAIAFVAGLDAGLITGIRRPAYLMAVVSLALWNLWCQGKVAAGYTGLHANKTLHLALDLFELSVLLGLSGAAANPFFNLIFFHTALVALLLKGREAAILVVELLVSVIALHVIAPDNFRHGTSDILSSKWVFLGTRLIAVFAIWQLLSSFARVHAEMREHLDRMRDSRLRLDRLRAIGALAAGFSHEFATPLNTAKMRLGRLFRSLPEGGRPPEDLVVVQESIAQCEVALRRLNDVRTDPDSISNQLSFMCKVVKEGVERWRAANNGFAVHVNLTPDGRCAVPTLPFTQVLLDLLENAKRASKDGGSIEVTVTTDNKTSELLIVDHGSGWPKVVKERLGEPFVSTSADGSGLGLYHAYSVAHALGGSLELRDTAGGGATVCITLPCAAGKVEGMP